MTPIVESAEIHVRPEKPLISRKVNTQTGGCVQIPPYACISMKKESRRRGLHLSRTAGPYSSQQRERSRNRLGLSQYLADYSSPLLRLCPAQALSSRVSCSAPLPRSTSPPVSLCFHEVVRQFLKPPRACRLQLEIAHDHADIEAADTPSGGRR